MPNSTVTEQHEQAKDIYRQYEGFRYRRYAGNEDGKKGARSFSFGWYVQARDMFVYLGTEALHWTKDRFPRCLHRLDITLKRMRPDRVDEIFGALSLSE